MQPLKYKWAEDLGSHWISSTATVYKITQDFSLTNQSEREKTESQTVWLYRHDESCRVIRRRLASTTRCRGAFKCLGCDPFYFICIMTRVHFWLWGDERENERVDHWVFPCLTGGQEVVCVWRRQQRETKEQSSSMPQTSVMLNPLRPEKQSSSWMTLPPSQSDFGWLQAFSAAFKTKSWPRSNLCHFFCP